MYCADAFGLCDELFCDRYASLICCGKHLANVCYWLIIDICYNFFGLYISSENWFKMITKKCLQHYIVNTLSCFLFPMWYTYQILRLFNMVTVSLQKHKTQQTDLETSNEKLQDLERAERIVRVDLEQANKMVCILPWCYKPCPYPGVRSTPPRFCAYLIFTAYFLCL